MRNSMMYILISIISCLFLQSGYAVEEEVILFVGNRPVTNLEVLEEAVRHREIIEDDSRLKIFESTTDDMLTPIIFEQYAAQNGIKVTEQEVMDSLTASANSFGCTLEEFFQKSKTSDENIEDTKKRFYKLHYEDLLEHKVIEHFNPAVSTVTEEDLQKWIEFRKTVSAPMGVPEKIRFQGIVLLASDYAKESVRKELDRIRERLNAGESFETVAGDYAGRKEYRTKVIRPPKTVWTMTSTIEKQGLDALTPWSMLKGKAVVVKLKGFPFAMVIEVVDYLPDTQMSVEAAVNDKNLRQVCIDEARGYKYRLQKHDFIKKRKRDVVAYKGNKQEIWQKLIEQYKIFRAESGHAVEEEVILDVGGRPVTNLEVLERVAQEAARFGCSDDDAYFWWENFAFFIDNRLPPIIFEQYAAQNGIKVTEQEVMDSLTARANSFGETLEESFQKSKTRDDNNIEDTKKRLYKLYYEDLLEHKVIEHFNPAVNTVTEEDLQKWIEFRKNVSAPIGEPERIQYQGIVLIASEYAKESVRKELDRIRKRLNAGESFETVAGDYAGRNEYRTEVIRTLKTDWVMTSAFEKQGLDALIPWSMLKGKAVVVKGKELPFVMVIEVIDYLPDTQMSVEAALNDKNMRQVCIDEARGYKYLNQRYDFIEKGKREMVAYKGNKQEICRKLVSQYKMFLAETRANDPNSTP